MRLATDAAGLGVWAWDAGQRQGRPGRTSGSTRCSACRRPDEPVNARSVRLRVRAPGRRRAVPAGPGCDAQPGHAAALRGALLPPQRPGAALDRAHRHPAARRRRRAPAHPGHRGRHHGPQAGRGRTAPQRGALPHAVRVDRRGLLHHRDDLRRGRPAGRLPFPGNQPGLREAAPGCVDAVGKTHAGTGARPRGALVRHLWPCRARRASRCASRTRPRH